MTWNCLYCRTTNNHTDMNCPNCATFPSQKTKEDKGKGKI